MISTTNVNAIYALYRNLIVSALNGPVHIELDNAITGIKITVISIIIPINNTIVPFFRIYNLISNVE